MFPSHLCSESPIFCKLFTICIWCLISGLHLQSLRQQALLLWGQAAWWRRTNIRPEVCSQSALWSSWRSHWRPSAAAWDKDASLPAEAPRLMRRSPLVAGLGHWQPPSRAGLGNGQPSALGLGPAWHHSNLLPAEILESLWNGARQIGLRTVGPRIHSEIYWYFCYFVRLIFYHKMKFLPCPVIGNGNSPVNMEKNSPPTSKGHRQRLPATL